MNQTNFFTAAKSTYSIYTNINRNEYRQTPPVALDRLAKTFYAEVMIDTGNPNATVLTDPNLLEDWTRDFPDNIELLSAVSIARGIPTRYEQAHHHPPAGRLGTSPSRINLQYICEVPRLRPIPSVVGSVVVADLVYLQALWMVYTWALTRWTKKHDPRALYCEGCMKQMKEDGPCPLKEQDHVA